MLVNLSFKVIAYFYSLVNPFLIFFYFALKSVPIKPLSFLLFNFLFFGELTTLYTI
nr:MAG TPA: hypothetical protein [Caudoviricetes sp.]